MDVIPTDNYGPLNRYHSGRNARYNPGGEGSDYNLDGTLKSELDEESVEHDDLIHIEPVDPPDIHELQLEPNNGLRRSRRGKYPPFVPHACPKPYGKCPITWKNIQVPFFLEADNRCYEAESIRNLQPVAGMYVSPMTRHVFTENDLTNLTILKNAHREVPRRETLRRLRSRPRSRSRSRSREREVIQPSRSRGGKKCRTKKCRTK